MRVLIGRDLKLRYKRSVVGIGWSFVTPLAQIVVLHFVFTRLLPLGIPDYATFLFIGIAVWTWLSASLDQATTSIVDNRELVRQAGFPSAILPVVTVAANLIHFVLALPIVGLFLWLGDARPHGWLLPLLPLLIALQFLVTAGIAFFVATAQVTFRDTKHLLGVSLMLGFYLTPIFYTPEQVPERFATLYNLNPIVPVLGGYRHILMSAPAPSIGGLLWVAGLGPALVFLGYRTFRRTRDRFVDEL